MPPQPLSFINSNASFSLTADGFEKRPAVAQGIAQCIAYWSWVETQVSRLYVTLLGGNEETAAASYNALESAKAKRNAILSLALSHLAVDEVDVVKALLRYVKAQQSTRDRIAHWMWGLPSDDLPDAMILVDPKFLIMQHAKGKAEIRTAARPTFENNSIPRDKVFVYHSSELFKDADKFRELAQLVNKLSGVCYELFERSYRDKLLEELRRDSRLAPYLRR